MTKTYIDIPRPLRTQLSPERSIVYLLLSFEIEQSLKGICNFFIASHIVRLLIVVHVHAALQEITVHEIPVGEITSAVSEPAITVRAYRLIKCAVRYGVLRLDGIAHHVQDVLPIDGHEQLQSFLSRVGVVAYRESLFALLDLALDSLSALDAYEVGLAVVGVESDIVVILAGHSAEISGIS